MKWSLAKLAVVLAASVFAFGQYDLPNNDADCPANCRQIPWSAGSDLWNSGTLPVYTQDATCSGLTQGDGTTNNAAAINACITAAASGHAVAIPAGIYYVNSVIAMKSNVALRGAKPSGPPFLPAADAGATTFKLGASGQISFYQTGSLGSNVAIASGYTKGSTSIVMNAGHGFVTGDWIIVSENPDTAIPVTKTGDDGDCTWCGENDGVHLMTQIVQATVVSGNTVTLGRPLYYTFASGLSPVARKIPLGINKAGLENIRLNGAFADHPAFINMVYSLYNWVKGVETYDAGSNAKNSHVESEWSYGSEIRDSYFHYGRSNDSDTDYGIAFLFPNSDHKVENNVMRGHRHSISFEGGGSGCVILYNFTDDNYESPGGTPNDYLGSARANHGAHPYMNLWEGNIYSHIIADSFWGSSSHNVFFRNWLWGNESANVAPENLVPVTPTWGFGPLSVWTNQNYYSFVGNVLGTTASGMMTSINWSTYQLRPTGAACSYFQDGAIYDYGCNSIPGYSSVAGSSSINHGNYDYKTVGVAYWEGGSNHTLRSSMYYGSKPGFFGTCAWPPFGPEPTITLLPARARFLSDSSCAGAGGTVRRRVAISVAN